MQLGRPVATGEVVERTRRDEGVVGAAATGSGDGRERGERTLPVAPAEVPSAAGGR
ncbi:hypothetical protein [Embleya scabrispora]|uniref:hypothetical protein n=1 Tax=Embleya scabrispora TaxID=159449 RepID=UPI0013751BE2|nr:hypothetical protein [Embleya scabrispora]